MRKVILFNLITLEGFFKGAGSDISWHPVDDELDFHQKWLSNEYQLMFNPIVLSGGVPIFKDQDEMLKWKRLYLEISAG